MHPRTDLVFSDASAEPPTDLSVLKCTKKSTYELLVSTENVHAVVLALLNLLFLESLVKKNLACAIVHSNLC